MKETSVERLEKETIDFLRLHWNPKEIKTDELLIWKIWKDFKGSMPFGDKQGCYALLSNGYVVYIGVGASSGSGIYEGCGLGARVTKYTHLVKKGPLNERIYEPNKCWKEKGVTGIMTFGFPSGFGYLAYALEVFLVFRLEPQYNTNRPGS